MPILVGLASLVAYMTYLLPEDALPLPIASLAMGIALVVVLLHARSLLSDPGSAGLPERTAGG